jgi:hypothetical protein
VSTFDVSIRDLLESEDSVEMLLLESRFLAFGANSFNNDGLLQQGREGDCGSEDLPTAFQNRTVNLHRHIAVTGIALSKLRINCLWDDDAQRGHDSSRIESLDWHSH